jgi:Domain of unknown function (DUF4160)
MALRRSRHSIIALGYNPQRGGSMPTVLRSGPYRFFFYAGDADEPPHVHVERDANTAKFWLKPVRLERSGGFGRREITAIEKLVEQNREALVRSWNEFFGS